MLIFILISSILSSDSPLVYPLLYLQIRGFINIPVIKPYEINEVLYEIDTLLFMEEKFNRVDKKFISLFGPFLAKSNDIYAHFNFSAENINLDDFYGNFDYQIGGRITNHISFAQGVRFKAGSKIDSTGPKPWKDIFQSYLTEGFFKVSNQKVSFLLGRRNLTLGFGDEYSLLLSLAPEGYDGFLFNYSGQYYEFNSSFSVLDVNNLRLLATHRIGLNLNNFKIGFSESILWANEVEPLYLNFLLPYYLSQWGMDKNDNIMWCFDAAINIFNTLVFTEFLIDDYQYSEPPTGYPEYPSKLAFQGGIKKIVSERIYFKFNYTFVDKWVYTHAVPANVYQNDSLPLGFKLGNDVDNIILNIKFLNRAEILPGLKIEYTRKGEGSIFLPYEIEQGSAYPEFPSGIVEKRLKTTGEFDCYLGAHFYLHIAAGKEYCKNYKHISGNKISENIFNLRIWLFF